MPDVTGSPFRSFWMGGYEGADHLNAHGVPLDMARCTGHLDRLEEDYARAAALGLKTVRESIGWRLTEQRPGRFDFARVRAMALAAQRHDIQILWTLMHYGTPADVSLLDDSIVERFAHFAAAVAETLAPLHTQAPVYNPINEIGFLAWAVSETSLVHPYRRDLAEGATESTESSGFEVKRRLARAVLAGIDAIRRVDARARFLHVEPLVHVTTPPGRADLRPLAEQVSSYQWQAWDLIGGLAEPEIGGSLAALDLIGVNHYHSGQWEVTTEKRLWWHLRDPRRRPFSALLEDAWQRYRRPLMIAETGHIGAGRAAWLHEAAAEVEIALRRGVPVGGICLYPLIDRPDWNDANHWHHSGLWQVDRKAPTEAAVLGPGPAHGNGHDHGDRHGNGNSNSTSGTGDPTRHGNGAVPGKRRGDAATVSGAGIAGPVQRPLAPARRLIHLECAEAIALWRQRLPAGARRAADRPCLIAASPRRWVAGRGRLQNLMLQLARDFRVLIVEAPLSYGADYTDADALTTLLVDIGSGHPTPPRLDHHFQQPGLELLVPRAFKVPLDRPGAWDSAVPLVTAFLRREGIEEADFWLPSADALPLLGAARARRIVYDCGQASYAIGPTDASGPDGRREAALIDIADVVVTRSPGLHERLERLDADVQWLPDAVDAERFKPSALVADSEEGDAVCRLQRRFTGPRLGYFGRIDRRLDFELLVALADQRPDSHIVMVGPLEGMEPGQLPLRPNLHWLGPQPYARIPYFAASWDACLLPFVTTAANRWVCPSQTLEYLAAEKPVIATALPDVVRLFASFIHVGGTIDSFVQACHAALKDDPARQFQRALGARAMLSGLSWERSAGRVRRLLEREDTVPATPAARSIDGAGEAPAANENRSTSAARH